MFKNKLLDLMVEKSISSQRQLSILIDIPTTTINGWLNAGRLPDYASIIKLANFFSVSADYLLGLIDDFGTSNAAPADNGLTSEERELLRLFRELSPYLKGMTLTAVRSWAKNDGDSERKKV